jgi:hypothetical protein
MPIIERRSNLTPNNARNSDVAHNLTEHIAPMQQQKMMAAFRVQGIQAILYSKLTQGRICSCASRNNQASKLSPDGKASSGAINRILGGNENFGVSNYNPYEIDITEDPTNRPSSRANSNQWLGTDHTVGSRTGSTRITELSLQPKVGDNQSSPDLEDLFADFDMGHFGLTDVSCPICFGTTFVGGYTMFRGFRKVLVPQDFDTLSYLDLETFCLSPGTHEADITLPKGACVVDVFRAMNGNLAVPANFYLDNKEIKNVLHFCDGLQHRLKVVTESSITHLEIQLGLNKEPIYFEVPKRPKSSDLSLLAQEEPFQVIVSPDVPNLQTLDIIAESQLGKILIVQSCSPWNTRNRQMLGWECQVRVAQPQELWNILPFRRHIAGQRVVHYANPSKEKQLGVIK